MKQNSLIFRFNLSLPLAMAMAVLGGTQANAADITWGNVGSDFATGANWVGGTAPANDITSDIAVFPSGVTANPRFNADRSVNGLLFDTGAMSFSINGLYPGMTTLTLGSGGITNNSGNRQFFVNYLQLALGSDSTFSGNSALDMQTPVNLGNFTLTLDGTDGGNALSREISGTGGVVKRGSGSWYIVANSYTGGTTINAGTVHIAHESAFGTGAITFNGGTVVNYGDGGIPTTNDYVLNGDATLDNQAEATWTNSGVISGTGNLILDDQSLDTVTLSGTNTYTGTTTINGGGLAVSNGAAIADTGAVILADAFGATFTVQNSETIGSLRGGGETGGDVIIASGQTLTVAETGSQTFAGIIGDAGGLAKTGVGTLTLTGTNTYTGPTSVTGGQLVVNGSSSDSAHTVGSGGTLGGSGTVGALVVQNGGTIAPGNSPGILNVVGNTTWLNGGNYNWQVLDADGVAGTGWDQLAITGALDLSNLTAGGFNVNVWSLSTFSGTTGNALNFNASLSYSWPIATASGGITGFDAGDFSIFTAANNGTNGFTNPFTGGFSMSVTGNNLNLNYGPTPVPEPASAFTVLALFSGAVLNRRKRVVKH